MGFFSAPKQMCPKCGREIAPGELLFTDIGSEDQVCKECHSKNMKELEAEQEQRRKERSARCNAGPDANTSKKYVVLQVTLKEKFFGTASGNLWELEDVINEQAAKGYRLHTISTTSANSTGFGGGDRIQATMVFEKI